MDTDDLLLIRQLALLMGWGIYTEEDGQYNQWQRRLVANEQERSCFVDLDGKVWVWDGVPLHSSGVYTTGSERLWNPLHAIGDAWRVVEAVEARGYWIEVGLCNGKYGPQKRAWCHIGEYGEDGRTIEEFDDNPCRAIALAALALRTEEGEG